MSWRPQRSPLAGLTALRLLRASGVIAGLRVLLTGASGGVGHYLTERASATGASLTAVRASRERAERLLALGAANVVRSPDDAGGPYDVAFESVGGSDACDLATLVTLVARDRLHPEIGVVADWTRTASLLQDLRDRRIRGNAVLRIDQHCPSPTTPTGDVK